MLSAVWLVGRWWNKPLLTSALLVIAGGLAVGAWLVDTRLHDGAALRNVSLEDRLVGGMGEADLNGVLAASAERVESSPVTIDLGDQTIEFLAGELGVGIDSDATRAAILDAGRAGSLWEQFHGWAVNLDDRRRVDVVHTFDADAARSLLARHPLAIDRQPVDPSATFNGEVLVAVEGAPGRGLDVEQIVGAIANGVATGDYSHLRGAWLEIPSPILFGEAESLVAGIKNRVAAGIIVTIGDTARWVPPKPLYSWMSTTSERGHLELEFDGSEALQYVESLFADVWVGDLEPTFDVVDDRPVFADLRDTRTVCCASTIVPMLEAVVLGDTPQPIEAPLRPPSNDESLLVARKLGVTDLVGEFTTEHACCQTRVTNIHRIADIIRGYVIAPDEVFSVNEYVGRRTRDNGFVSAGVIQSGRFDDAVGGGISQFATTLFNAAFFAGLDIPEYQSHSIYISRYPYGREATVSFPVPDLVIHNTTPYHVLIWTSYTDTSITVQMYSTPHTAVAQTGQAVSSLGACTRVETFRERVYPDGQVVADSVFATYRPGEGLDCRGRPTPRT